MKYTPVIKIFIRGDQVTLKTLQVIANDRLHTHTCTYNINDDEYKSKSRLTDFWETIQYSGMCIKSAIEYKREMEITTQAINHLKLYKN